MATAPRNYRLFCVILWTVSSFLVSLCSTARISCTAAWINHERGASVTCTLGKNVYDLKNAFSVVHYPFSATSETPGTDVVVCIWPVDSATPECAVRDGYRMNDNISENVTISIPNVTASTEGQYACHLVPMESDTPVEMCEVKRIDTQLTTTPRPPESSTGEVKTDTQPVGLIAGLSAVGGVLVIVVVIIACIVWRNKRRRKRKREKQENTAASETPGDNISLPLVCGNRESTSKETVPSVERVPLVTQTNMADTNIQRKTDRQTDKHRERKRERGTDTDADAGSLQGKDDTRPAAAGEIGSRALTSGGGESTSNETVPRVERTVVPSLSLTSSPREESSNASPRYNALKPAQSYHGERFVKQTLQRTESYPGERLVEQQLQSAVMKSAVANAQLKQLLKQT